MANKTPPTPNLSRRTTFIKLTGLLILAVILILFSSIQIGGHVAGPTYIAPGNVGLVIDNYHGVVESQLMPAGTHWQGIWETVIEVPTAQRTISLTGSSADGNSGAVQVNTISNMLQVDVSTQYNIMPEQARNLYHSYQDQFADIGRFETENLEPAVKGAINIAIGDMDTTTALTTAGKNKAENEAKAALNAEWEPRGIVFSNVMIRGIQQDQASKDLLATTLTKLQDIDNAKLALQQQQFDNATLLLQATSEAKVNRLKNSTLTDLFIQDALLSRVKKVYLPSDELMGLLK
jgi:hypothetical protein